MVAVGAGSGSVGAEPLEKRVSAVVGVVVGPARRRRGVGLVVVLAESRRVVGGGVDVGLLQRRLVEVGPLVGQQVVFVQRLRRETTGGEAVGHRPSFSLGEDRRSHPFWLKRYCYWSTS